MFYRLDVLTVTSLLQRSVKPGLLCRTKHKQNKAFCKWFISKSKHIYIPHVLEVKTWIKADLKWYMKRHYYCSFWLVFAILWSILPKSVSVFTPSGITWTLKTTLALYLQYDMANVICRRELGSSEHGDATFCSVQSGKALHSLADTHSVYWKLHSYIPYNATFTGDEPRGTIQHREIPPSTSVAHSGNSYVWQMNQNIFRLLLGSTGREVLTF